MRKLFHILLMVAVIAGLFSLGGLPTAPAQKKDKKEEVGRIEVYQDKKGDWRFRVVDEEDKSVAIGTVGFEKKEDVLKTLEFVKTTFAKAKVTEVKGDKKDKKDKDK